MNAAGIFNKSLTGNLLAGLMCLVLVACSGTHTRLNSDRIEAKYGSYGVELVNSQGRRRETSLYSTHDGERITRTYAIVYFMSPDEPALDFEHRAIRAGGSIGKTFREAGWEIR